MTSLVCRLSRLEDDTALSHRRARFGKVGPIRIDAIFLLGTIEAATAPEDRFEERLRSLRVRGFGRRGGEPGEGNQRDRDHQERDHARAVTRYDVTGAGAAVGRETSGSSRIINDMPAARKAMIAAETKALE